MTVTTGARRFSGVNLLIFLLGMTAIALLLFPTAANWLSTIHHDEANARYTQQVTGHRESGAVDRLLAEAEAYNAALPTGQLRDPYTTTSTAPGLDPARYAAQLDLGADGVVARVRYPRLGIDLPVYLGTGADVLRKGVGHLFGSSLPVGGASTHSVLTAHSGAPYATLFDPIHDARPGDLITVEVGDRRLVYRVTGTETVRPDDTSSLGIQPGTDLLTLLTCTPIGVASHRLLVHAERVPDDEPAAERVELDREPGAGLLEAVLTACWMPAALVAAAGLWSLVPPVRTRRRGGTGDEPQAEP
ncbi:class C sortase [Agromyces sp. NPDC060279]|uniref:class C sortase n=1 Tax=Agromyces sp. NPDC060279 TaxID=3347092 RepID=UPI003647BF42